MSRSEEEPTLSQLEAIPVKVNGIELDLEQKRQLIKHLLVSPVIKDRYKRVQLAKRLSVSSSLLKRTEQENELSFILLILKHCAQLSDTIDQFVYEIGMVERIDGENSYELKAFNVFLHNLFHLTDREFNTTISFVQLRELHSLLTKIDWQRTAWINAYKASMPDGTDLPDDIYADDKSEIPFSVLSDLTSMRPHNERVTIAPILEFVERLIRYTKSEIQSLIETPKEQATIEGLSEWSEKRANEFGISRELNWLRKHLSFYELPTVTHLLIALYPLDAKSEFFRVSAWFVNDEDTTLEKANMYTKEPVNRRNIAQCIGEVQKWYDQYRLSENFTIELFLPTKLLSAPVENYKITPNELENRNVKIKLGIQYDVVVRSLKRATDRRIRERWKDKWTKHKLLLQMKNLPNGDEAASNAMLKICNIKECRNEESLYSKLKKSDVVYLTTEFAPPRTSTLFDIAIAAGIPVALWPREVCNTPDTFPNLLKTLLLQPYDWLSTVKQQREAALEDRRHQGQHLTLLWDNPHRVPRDIAEGLLVAPR